MNIDVNDEFKFAVIWLTNEEKESQNIQDSIKSIMAEYRQKKYKFVIMESGRQDLLELTKSLLNHNKNLAITVHSSPYFNTASTSSPENNLYSGPLSQTELRVTTRFASQTRKKIELYVVCNGHQA